MIVLNKNRRKIAAFLLLVFLSDMVLPTAALALTGGPSQPEVQSFEPAQTNQMVDIPTGDFTYNLPLLDVGGYPVNISYHSGINMDEEASWVGLGWNINPGVINRQMRGLPDDFSGDPISKEYNIRTNWTAGVDLGVGVSFVELPIGLGQNMGIYYNNYRGVGFKGGISFSFTPTSMSSKGTKTSNLGVTLSLGLSFDSQNGIGVSPGVGLSISASETDGELTSTATGGANVGIAYNSRTGLQQLTYGLSYSVSNKRTEKQKHDTKLPEIDKILDEKDPLPPKVSSQSRSISRSSSISFNSQGVTPSVSFPMDNFGFNAKVQIGGMFPLYAAEVNISGDINGSYSQQKLQKQSETLKGYGYMYMHDANGDVRAMLDFNREKDQVFRKPKPSQNDEGTPMMSMPSYQYDLLGVSGQGIGGQYRSMRNDIGYVYDPLVTSGSGSGSFAMDIGLGQYVTIGADINASVVTTTTGKWEANNELSNKLNFFGHDNTLFEPAGFVNIGEKTINDQAYYNTIGDVNAIQVKLDGSGSNVKAKAAYQKFKNGVASGSATNFTQFKNPNRAKRNQVLSYITAGEASAVVSPKLPITLDREIVSFEPNVYHVDLCGNNTQGKTNISRKTHSNERKKHISEVSVIGADGQRYVYGIPAYNRLQQDVTFNVKPQNGNNSTGLVSYTATVDNSLGNTNGQDHFFSRETMPDFAHSYLLTAILSPDYVDLTGNGISDDDLGNAVQLNYSRVYGEGEDKGLYKWRVPYEKDTANYQEGYKTDTKDDKGNYTYGEKEIWYLHSIVSKTNVALFRLSNREDALGVSSDNGGLNTNAKMKKIDKIDLFSKSDLIKYGQQAKPIKTVHFKYSYKLCPNVPNNSGAAVDENGNTPSDGNVNVNANKGKLTLEKIYFTYQSNTKGRLNPYVFHYDDNNNPAYHMKKYDRWGNYKNNDLQSLAANEVEFPYTLQDKVLTDKFVAAWSIKKIDLPTGGTINVDYESDDYAYVQDKRAQQMFQIEGLGSSPNFSTSNLLYTAVSPSFNGTTDHNCYVYIKSPTPLSNAEEVFKKYLEGIDYLYYRIAVKMYSNHADAIAEYVPGYCKIESHGVCPNATNYFWVKLKPEPVGNDGAEVTNPMTKSAWQFLRMNLPKLAYPGSENDPADFVSVIKSLMAPLFDIQNIFMGFSRSCMTRKWCREIVKERSWLRLNNPDYAKLGGGLRVKSVTISDEWSNMVSGEPTNQFGQVYDYTTQGPDGTGRMSSGVAEYEPIVGNDENPFRQPLQFKQKTRLAPNNQFFMELPVGETFFPSANVAYSKVTVRSYGSTQVAASKGTGYSVHRHYTAKDFPIITDRTSLDPRLYESPSIFQIFSFPKEEYFTGSQGFVVEMNDMHGKPRGEEVYDNAGVLISKTEFKYKVDNPNANKLHLKNEVSVLMPNGEVRPNIPVGKSIELMTDFRDQTSEGGSGGAMIAVDLSVAIPIFPIPIPLVTVFPAISFERTQFRSATTMKIVRRFGIVESTVAHQYGSKVETKNLVFDSETGEVVLTQTTNEYDMPVYSLVYPSHFAYEGMGSAYKNVGAEFKKVKFLAGKIVSPTNIESYFTEGDEVFYQKSGGIALGGKLWVTNPKHTDPNQTAAKIFIDENGNPFNQTGTEYFVKIIRSGRRNLSSTPIASVSSLKLPILNNELNVTAATEVLNTSATEYSDQWKINCEKITQPDCDVCNTPSCDCMYNLLRYIDDNNLWEAQPQDSVFVNMCCIDSCFYSNGQLSTDYCNGCKRHFYSLKPISLLSNNYKAVVGRCTLELKKSNDVGILSNINRPLSSLIVLKPADVVQEDTTCSSVCNRYLTTGEYTLQSVVMMKPVVTYYATLSCPPVCRQVCVDLSNGTKVNPYRFGLLGNWRPQKQWVYRTMRTPDTLSNLTGNTNIRKDGILASYDDFWVYDQIAKKFIRNINLSSKYIDATTITKYNSKGAEIENRDAAGIYSTAQFGYLETQAVAVAKNARYKQIGFDGFEDYVFTTDCNNPCRVEHFNFREVLDNGCLAHCGEIDSAESHTGNSSMKILSTGSGKVSLIRDLKQDNDGVGLTFNANTTTYHLTNEGCLPKFSPDTGRYFISAWVKEPANCTNLQYQNSKLAVSFTGAANAYDILPSGNIIEGWQRLEGVISVPAAATQIKIELVALNGVVVHFDDVRIQPFNSSMKTYAYDARSLRLMAEHDENNFATFYEYDDEGRLVRVKKETDRGVMTIQENRSTLKRK